MAAAEDLDLYARKTVRERARQLVDARAKAGLTQAALDAAYRKALEANPGTNAGGRGGLTRVTTPT